MKDSASIIFPSHPKYLSAVRAFAARMGEIAGLSEKNVEEIKLAVDEACSNVIKYAYGGNTDREIALKCRIGKRGFEVIIEDSGIKAKPKFLKGRDLDDVKPGGLGLHFIKKAFDVFSYDAKKKKGNRLRLIKRWRKDNED